MIYLIVACAAPIVIMSLLIASAPTGYEDDDGYHAGRPTDSQPVTAHERFERDCG